jgi:hypothetical protein
MHRDDRIDPARNGEASYADPNGAIDAAVKAKLDNYQHDYREQATVMRIDIAPHTRPRRKQTRHVPDPHYFHLHPHARLHY